MSRASKRRRELEPVEREAHAWVRRLASGEATVDDAQALEQWRRQSPRHVEAFAAASRLWDSVGPAGRNVVSRSGTSDLLQRPKEASRPFNRRALLVGGLAAASAASVAVVYPPFGLWPAWSELRADYRTGTGEQRQVALGNSISIDMNTQTSITLRPGGGANRIELISGEAVITTSPGAARPFTVIASNGRTIADQAKFEVRHLDDQVCVTCLEGSVQVAHGHRVLAIRGGQQVSYDDRRLGESVAVDPIVASAWQEGLLIFRDTPLTAVVGEVNRYRPGKIFLLNAQLGRNLVNGRFRIDRVDEILAQLQLAFGAQVRSLPGGIVLLS